MLTLSKRIQSIEESATMAVSEKAAQLKAKGVDIISFGSGEPDFDTPAHIKQSAVLALEQGHTKYTAASGMLKLREAVARKLERENNLSYPPSSVIISCGAKHSLFNAFHALCDDGDEVLIPSPYWTSYPEIAKTAGGKPVTIQTAEANGFKLTPDLLKRHLTSRSKILVLNSPCNPTGSVYTHDELRRLSEALKGTSVAVLSDEVYEKLVYGSARHVSPASINSDMYARTITINSVSKSFAMTGWRIGYAAGPAPIMEGISRLQSQATSNPTSISQHAAVAALDGDSSCIRTMVQEYERRRNAVMQTLRKVRLLSCIEPQGAFYIFPNVSAVYGKSSHGKTITNSVGLCTMLLEEARVAIVPGAAFGSDAHIRITYSIAMDRLQEGLNRVAQFIEQVR